TKYSDLLCFEFWFICEVWIIPNSINTHSFKTIALDIDLGVCEFDTFVSEFSNCHFVSVYTFVCQCLFNWQTMCVPTWNVRCIEPSHLLVSVDEVFDDFV